MRVILEGSSLEAMGYHNMKEFRSVTHLEQMAKKLMTYVNILSLSTLISIFVLAASALPI